MHCHIVTLCSKPDAVTASVGLTNMLRISVQILHDGANHSTQTVAKTLTKIATLLAKATFKKNKANNRLPLPRPRPRHIQVPRT